MEMLALQILLLCQVVVGTVGNILLFVHNFSPVLTDSRLRPIQVILINLAVANAFMLLLLTYSHDMIDFVPRKPPTDLKCKLAYFFHMVAQGTIMCSTCVLSTYQFVTVVPGTWARVMFREISPKVVSYSCFSCWLFSVLHNAYIPMNVSGPQKTHNDSDSKGNSICSISGVNVDMHFLRFSHDIIFLGIMAWTSVSMMIHLNRHHQRMNRIHKVNQNNRGHAETRAAHTILMLVVTFVSLYILNCISILFHISFVESRLWSRHVIKVLALSFPTISPLLLIFRDPRGHCSLLFSVGLEIHVTGGVITEEQ
ncbi:vomeronasal 1 receptor 59 [Mus musculus]|jgi:vomeronasal1 receptor|uniref:Vomeronasal type-1 receptor n=2 Tax=Mus musculus TaxID=10090 RepID=Q8R2B9_MOUSE|nr:vomeronasal 1 receptor 59 [Mus musculus]AAI56710.1 Vomeronasal 1 receptor, D10 [synthetic construct]AAL47896.1 vomeronasal receptor V1RD10 [Mus musculus]EDL31297.1 mCG63924 [Mus musculus]|eukprot:NP_997426.1 vomeronasal 1 receptor 59 [Mus musculus]